MFADDPTLVKATSSASPPRGDGSLRCRQAPLPVCTKAPVCPVGPKKGSNLGRGRSRRKQPRVGRWWWCAEGVGWGGTDFFCFPLLNEPNATTFCHPPVAQNNTRCLSDGGNHAVFVRFQPGPSVRRLIINIHTLPIDRACVQIQRTKVTRRTDCVLIAVISRMRRQIQSLLCTCEIRLLF